MTTVTRKTVVLRAIIWREELAAELRHLGLEPDERPSLARRVSSSYVFFEDRDRIEPNPSSGEIPREKK